MKKNTLFLSLILILSAVFLVLLLAPRNISPESLSILGNSQTSKTAIETHSPKVPLKSFGPELVNNVDIPSSKQNPFVGQQWGFSDTMSWLTVEDAKNSKFLNLSNDIEKVPTIKSEKAILTRSDASKHLLGNLAIPYQNWPKLACENSEYFYFSGPGCDDFSMGYRVNKFNGEIFYW